MHEVWKRQQVHEDARKMHMAETLVNFFWKWEKGHLGGDHLVGRIN